MLHISELELQRELHHARVSRRREFAEPRVDLIAVRVEVLIEALNIGTLAFIKPVGFPLLFVIPIYIDYLS